MIAIVFVTFGLDGSNLPIQLVNPYIPYAFTFSQATVFMLAIIFLVQLFMIGLTLFLSARIKNAYLVLAVIIPVLFLPLFFSTTGTTGIYNLTILLLPYRAAAPQFGSYVSYPFGTLVIDVFHMRTLVYVLGTLIIFPFIGSGFKNHQVS
jgi:hypothetical protein